jgi:cytidine deaminase
LKKTIIIIFLILVLIAGVLPFCAVAAERVAIFKAVSEGAHEIAKVAVVTDHENLTPPCGCCRQMIWEFAADDTGVIMANLDGDVRTFEIKELLPEAFDSRYLEGVG